MPYPCCIEGGKYLRRQLLVPALQVSWRSTRGMAGAGCLTRDTHTRINPHPCLWALLVSLLFSQSVGKTENSITWVFFYRIPEEQWHRKTDAISLPPINLGRTRVGSYSWWFPVPSTFFLLFLGSFLQQDAVVAPSCSFPSHGYGCMLKQGGDAPCACGTGTCPQPQAGWPGPCPRETAESRC